MLVQIIIFAVSLSVLLISANFFTNAAEKIGLKLGMSSFLVGVIIVGLGTSLPELVSAIIAVLENKSEIVTGAVIGSNVSNIFLIFGVITLYAKNFIYLKEEFIRIDLHFMLGSALIFVVLLFDGGIDLIDSIILLLAFGIYNFYLFSTEVPSSSEMDKIKVQSIKFPIQIIIVVASAVGVYLGADYVISSIVNISSALEIDESIVSATVLALGTSLPELVVSITASRRGNAPMAIGNILGSNIFNVLFIPGVAGLIGFINLPTDIGSFYPLSLIIASVFFYLITRDQRISKYEGMLMILFYVVFIYKVIKVSL